MKHPLTFVATKGKLAEALGLKVGDCKLVEEMVEEYVAKGKSMRELFTAVSDLDISDELWANFLYTFGYWQGQNGA